MSQENLTVEVLDTLRELRPAKLQVLVPGHDKESFRNFRRGQDPCHAHTHTHYIYDVCVILKDALNLLVISFLDLVVLDRNSFTCKEETCFFK